MITSANLTFSDQQAITATAASTNVIDTGATGTPFGFASAMVRDLGRDDDGVDISVTIDVAFNNLTTLQIAYQVSSDNATFVDVEISQAIPLASLTAGAILPIPYKIPLGANRRYHRLNYTVVGTAPTTGKITARMVAARQTNISYLGN